MLAAAFAIAVIAGNASARITQAPDAAGAAAKGAKMAAVSKVTAMLEELLHKITAEGEAEAKTYDKFACFCKDTTAEKSEAVSKGEDEQGELQATIADLDQLREKLDAKIAELVEKLKKTNKNLAMGEKMRDMVRKTYEKDAGDLVAAIGGLQAAIGTLKASKPSLLQLKEMAETIKSATIIANTLGLKSGPHAQKTFLALLQQDPSVPMQDYDFHSDGIIETLEKLLADFRKQKEELDKEEVESQNEFDMFKQELKDVLKTKTKEMEDAKKKKGGASADVETNSERLSTVSAELLADKEYLMELAKMCHERAITWDQRTEMRSNELSALATAIQIVKKAVAESTSGSTVRLLQSGNHYRANIRVATADASDEDFMESIEREAEDVDEAGGSGPYAFVQIAGHIRSMSSSLLQTGETKGKQPTPTTAREAVVAMLQNKGRRIKSQLMLKLASEISIDHFAKVKKLIQELIERLLQEAANETNQKGWCDKSTADAEQKRDYAVEEIAALNAGMAASEAEIAKLEEELAVLKDEIGELNAARAKAQKLRAAEQAENTAAIEEAQVGLKAIRAAIDILTKFYKTAAKAQVLSLSQQGPADDAPDAGFGAFEAYTGSQGSAGGIIGMMDVIKSDFERTISETHKEENEAKRAFRDLMTETGKSLAEKTTAEEEKTGYRDSASEKLEEEKMGLATQTSILQKSLETLIELKPVCVETGMSYEERVAMRQEEIEGLKSALCILENYGTDGMDEC